MDKYCKKYRKYISTRKKCLHIYGKMLYLFYQVKRTNVFITNF